MKSIKKVTITITLILAAASLYAAGITGQITKKLGTEDVTVTVGCKGGWVTVVPGDIKTPETDNTLSGILFLGTRKYVLNPDHTWTLNNTISLNVPATDSQDSLTETDGESILRIVHKETMRSELKNITKVNEVILPYSSDLGIDITNATLGIVKGKNVIYVQPNFEFHKYDKDHMGWSNTPTFRQQNVIEAMEIDLKSTDSETKKTAEKAKEELNAILAHSIYNGSIRNEKEKFKIFVPGNPEKNMNEYLRNYISKGPYKNKVPVYISEIYTDKKVRKEDFKYAEGSIIADSARKYLNWAVEYDLYNPNKQYSNDLYDKVDEFWGEEGNQTNNYYKQKDKEGNETEKFPADYDEDGNKRLESKGNPVPYVKGGIDTPRTFWYKMHIQNENNYQARYIHIYNTESYVPGVGRLKDIDDTYNLKYAGCDSLGFLTGLIEMSGLDKKISDRNGNYPASKLDDYTRDLTSENAIIKKDISQSKLTNEQYEEMRFKVEDIEKISSVIPYYSEIGIGDVLVRIKGEFIDVAVVVGKKESSKEGIQVIHINQKKSGSAEKTTWDLLENSDEYTPRRIIEGKNTIATVNYSDEDWDILGKQIEEKKSSVTVGRKYEQTQDITADSNWHFIPNTGEYLILDEIKVNLCNKAGVRVSDIYHHEYKVKLNVAYDRSYNETGAETSSGEDKEKGNIYRNRADSFQISLMSNQKTIGNSYKIKAPTTKNVMNEKYTTDESVYLTVGEDGNIFFITNAGLEVGNNIGIGIRPIKSAQAYPGDDLILAFTVYNWNTEQVLKFNEKDYIAVYDKKMLWRANLYIDEGTDTSVTPSVSRDWNNVHPWNAPPEEQKSKGTWADSSNSKTYLGNWNAKDWGYNEWNRKYTSEYTQNLGIYTEMKDLPVADGRQSVVFDEVKWYYGMENNFTSNTNRKKFEKAYDSTHVKEINNKVAYDYWGWDSPFSYRKKILEQKKLMKQLSNKDSIDAYTDMIFPLRYGLLLEDGYPTNAYYDRNKEESKRFYPKFFKTFNDINNPPTDPVIHSNYVQSTENNNVTLHPYVPGLSDSLSYQYNGSEQHPNKETSDMVAGTDCNGLVQSSVSYEGCIYKALDGNKVVPPFYGDNPKNTSRMAKFVNRELLSSPSQYTGNNRTAYEIGNIGNTEPKKDENGNIKTDPDTGNQINVYTFFKNVVPGDIIISYKLGGTPSHIMMVSSIDDADGINGDINHTMYWNDGSKVHIIESVYFNSDFNKAYKLFGCGKNRNCDVLKTAGREYSIWRLR